MALLTPSNLETHPTGTINLNGIIIGNWQTVNATLNPTETGPQRGILEAALNGQATLTTIAYAGSVNVSLVAKPLSLLALTGDVTIAVTDKAAGRTRWLIITTDGTDRNITWPVGVKFSGTPYTSLAANSALLLQIGATGTTDASLVITGRDSLDPSVVTLTGTQTLTNKTLTSPTFTGTPVTPTAAPGTNTTQVASTAYVATAISNLVASSPAALDTLNELAAALGNDANFAATVTASLAGKAPLASPTFTGTPAAPTAAPGTNSTQLATTAFVTAAIIAAAPAAYTSGNGLSLASNVFSINLAITADLSTAQTLTNKTLTAPTITGGVIEAATLKLASGAYVQLTGSRAATDADNGKILWSSAAYTLTVPDSLTKPFSCTLKQEGAGAITVAVSGTAVLRSIDTHTKTGGQWAVASIDYRTGNDVVLSGRTAA